MPIRVELHCHTDASPDSLLSISQLLEACQRKHIDKIAITDHNTIRNALLAHQIAPHRVIVGEEILTRQGELLALFVTQEIPPGLDAQEAIAELRKQGAFISVSHPFDPLRAGHWQKQALEKIVSEIDAVEVFNARCLSNRPNHQAFAFAAQHNLLGTVGSDAHTALEIGMAFHIMEEFQTPDQFRIALQSSNSRTRLSPFWVHLLSRYAHRKKSSKIA